MFKQLLNLRPYSWIDLIFLGVLAKFSISSQFIFSIKDIWFPICLLSLWFFFNILLEKKHSYSYRAKSKVIFAFLSLLISVVIGLVLNPLSLIPLTFSVILVFFYLQKNKDKFFGSLSGLFRGLIQSCYFVYAILLYTNHISQLTLFITLVIFLIYFARALIGDLRDFKHNKDANKQTIPTLIGKFNSIAIIEFLLFLSALLLSLKIYFWITIPLILLAISLLLFKNYYFLHQLTIITTMFFSLNLVFYFLGINLWLINLAYLGIILNMLFYPLLERKSNPDFK